jgi:ATP-dependent Lhr-like helicase
MKDPSSLDLFLPCVSRWFREALGEPTPAQQLGWPAIAAGQNTLILAPTGSGKTLAAFLACLDALWRQEAGTPHRGVEVLYISPLKALNNDVHRNLQVPLAGVEEVARRMGQPLPALSVGLRTGDTPTAERQRLIRRPPHVLITTPESLHLLLTSSGRETLRSVRWCIVDEIHALCSSKRGTFLALLLERLEAIQSTGRSFVRIGLSATQRPLEEVARYLGGAVFHPERGLVERPVTIVDAGLRKDLDLLVVHPVEHFGPLPERSVWPSIYRRLGEEIRKHRSTIVFTNDRRAAERITACLNEDEEIAHAHHGSVALEVRHQTEAALKEGRLPAVVATASLELGIDMGAVDLVYQIGSPGNVARGLQRVGRAGHLVGHASKGRFLPRTAADLLDQAVLAREMAAGRVEAVRVPINCLDVLAQQLVALAAMDDWDVPRLYALVRQAYPYRDLSPQAFETTLEMISGRYRFNPVEEAPSSEGEPSTPRPTRRSLEALQPRVSWDRIHNRLLALPGSRGMALTGGGTIPDTGQYGTYAPGNVRIGELDEEFVYETRVGDTFLLGTNTWRVDRIEADRVQVVPAEGAPGTAPFWRGEGIGRSADLGQAIGQFLRELSGRIEEPDCLDWLRRECFLDVAAARNLRHHVQRQQVVAGCVPTDETILIEASRDQLGDWQVLFLSPLGRRFHLTLRLALEARLRQRLGYRPQCMHHDDGLLVRLSDTDEPILDLLAGLTPESVEDLVLSELADSALFALRFRQNASRALLLPRGQSGRRAPLWLQRLRGRDLLQVARRHPDFPVVAETFRECLHDHLDLPRLQQLLSDVRDGRHRVVTRRGESPSPFSAGLLFAFTAAYMYDYDDVKADGGGHAPLDTHLLNQLVAPAKQTHLLDPRAVHQVERRLRGLGQPPRSAAEMAEWLRRLGDLAPADLEGPMAAMLEELERDGRACRIELPAGGRPCREPVRWASTEEADLYRQAFGLVPTDPLQAQHAGAAILVRFLATHALVGLDDVLGRYPFDPDWARQQLHEWAEAGRAVVVVQDGAPMQWSAPDNLDQVQRGSLALLRREVLTCRPAQFADFQLRWQLVHPEARIGEAEGLAEVLDRLAGLPLPVGLWETAILPVRVPGYQARWLDEWVAGGMGLWVSCGEGAESAVAFFHRDGLTALPAPGRDTLPALDEGAQRVLEALDRRGACFVDDLSHDTSLSPGGVRTALEVLRRRGLATNDRFDVLRHGEALLSEVVPTRTHLRPQRRSAWRPEGRWSMPRWGQPTPEEQAVAAAQRLLHRHGVIARELALLDPWVPPWRILYEVLSRMELAGDVRRGYFVEGLTGAQFALPEAAQALQDVHLPSTAAAPVVLLHSMDPANLYGAGAPFDIALLDGGTRPLLRRSGNWIVLRAGQPVLLIEQHGRKLTALASASQADITAAIGCLPLVLDYSRRAGGNAAFHKMTVEEWNAQPVTTSIAVPLLESAGFVRDYRGMTLYAAWRN